MISTATPLRLEISNSLIFQMMILTTIPYAILRFYNDIYPVPRKLPTNAEGMAHISTFQCRYDTFIQFFTSQNCSFSLVFAPDHSLVPKLLN
mmetsp:Transcript_12750/g.18549  ORF Transcript_12750/g.18549 Transcript_12750/m.18549 type:complete len:92 (+) Transcript_12750:119-394(+)